ncbi:MAG: RsmD family RNA methyltransferase [Collinsella sp.]
MRIIGGEWRGRKIEEPRGRDVTRPTTDRVREACASMVLSASTLIWTRFALDAFGGSGALGIEMLSRAPVRSPRSRSIAMPRGSLPRISSRSAATRALARGDGRCPCERFAWPRAGRPLRSGLARPALCFWC